MTRIYYCLVHIHKRAMTKETSLDNIQPSTWPRTKSKNICITYNCLGCFRFFIRAESWHVSVYAVARSCQTKVWEFFGWKVIASRLPRSFSSQNWFKNEKTGRQEEEQKKNTPQLVFRVSFAVVFWVLYRSNSRGTPNTRTSSTDVTFRNILWSDGNADSSESSAELWEKASNESWKLKR